MAETFQNGVSINYSVELEATLDDTSREALYAQLKNAFGQGGSRRGGIAVLEGGKLSAIKGSTPADADLRELRGALINEIAALFRVPASLVGGQSEKYSNVTARLASMYRDSFAPIIISIEQAFTNNLLSNGNTLRFDVGSLVKGDLATQITLATQAVAGGIITPNEARVFIGYPEIEGLDEVQAAPQAVPPDADRSGEETTDDGNMADMPDT
jgi:HK97 family phage portal protein